MNNLVDALTKFEITWNSEFDKRWFLRETVHNAKLMQLENEEYKERKEKNWRLTILKLIEKAKQNTDALAAKALK